MRADWNLLSTRCAHTRTTLTSVPRFRARSQKPSVNHQPACSLGATLPTTPRSLPPYAYCWKKNTTFDENLDSHVSLKSACSLINEASPAQGHALCCCCRPLEELDECRVNHGAGGNTAYFHANLSHSAIVAIQVSVLWLLH